MKKKFLEAKNNIPKISKLLIVKENINFQIFFDFETTFVENSNTVKNY
jgi:hypothetical protein